MSIQFKPILTAALLGLSAYSFGAATTSSDPVTPVCSGFSHTGTCDVEGYGPSFCEAPATISFSCPQPSYPISTFVQGLVVNTFTPVGQQTNLAISCQSDGYYGPEWVGVSSPDANDPNQITYTFTCKTPPVETAPQRK